MREPSQSDSLPHRGRGAAINPANRYERISLDILPAEREARVCEHYDGLARIETSILRDDTKSVLNPVDAPDLSFNWTVNPYRGCEHGCVYCYARPTHENLGFSSGLDFETRIVAKPDAPELLRKALASPKWKPEPIVMSGVTDPYQPVERQLKITRGCLEVMAEARQPVSLITKNAMITRDVDLLSELQRFNAVSVTFSITSLDTQLTRTMEPRASSPRERLEAIRNLHEAGIPVGVMVAPIIPGLNSHEVPAILKAAKEAGAQWAAWLLLRLPFEVKSIFFDWMQRHYPDRRSKVERFIRETRDGALNGSQFGLRFRGTGVIAEQIKDTFVTFAKREGLDRTVLPLSCDSFRRPQLGGQMAMFDV